MMVLVSEHDQLTLGPFLLVLSEGWSLSDPVCSGS